MWCNLFFYFIFQNCTARADRVSRAPGQSVNVKESDEMVDENVHQKSFAQHHHSSPSWNTKGTIITMASFMTTFITLGIIFSAGLLISEIVRIFENESTAKIAWIFSILNGTSMLAGKFKVQISNFDKLLFHFLVSHFCRSGCVGTK